MPKFIFRSNQTIGAAAAELDERFLRECFIDTGDLNILSDCEDPRRILLGRTGSGKSALISRLTDTAENAIVIRPESLALSYVSNSRVVEFFAAAGVKMDIFYRLLWRHVLVVEVLKARFHIDTEDRKQSFIESLWRLIPKNKQHETALAYLRQWGESFWKETEYRVQEVTSTLESELQGAAEASIPNVASLSAGAARKLTEEEKHEVVNRGQEVVDRVQIRELSSVIDLLRDVLLSDSQRRFYVAIDKLDEDWAEDPIRFRLIRALIETSLDFARIPNLKVIIALRNDLLDRVFRYTRDTGFQEEKYRTSSLQLSWTQSQLVQLLDSRIRVLVRDLYTKKPPSHEDLLPTRIGRQPGIDYMLERTHFRPRDLIQFFNVCIRTADGKASISERVLFEAEGTYSRERLRALADEWYGLYPNLLHLSRLLHGRPDFFLLREITQEELETNCLQLLVPGQGVDGVDLQYMKNLYEGALDFDEYRYNIVLILYKTGLVGLKPHQEMLVSWADSDIQSVSRAELGTDTRIYPHKAYWRTLGIPGSK